MALLGRGALLLALALSLYAALAGTAAGVRGDRRFVQSARNAVYALLGVVLVAAAVLLQAIVRHDFSFQTVAQTSSRSLPLAYTITSFWSSQAGSLLLWLTILSAASALVVRANRRTNGALVPWVIAILGTVSAFFSLLLVVAANPFITQAAPADGNGMDPSLQNPYMVAHPPSLYLGYVGLTVPFAFCMAALLARRTDARWIVSTRRWTLGAWAFLAIGMLLGAHWAYVEVGWGGYWAWDPVENAALMPWLVATAFLHSVMVQEKKGMLKVWNVCLVTATFALCILGTFLTRSGILSSIHAFAVSNVGWYFVGFIAVILAGSTALILARLPTLRSEHHMESLVSREATFLFNNLLLVGIAFAVLWGVLFPLLSQAVAGTALSVSSPFFEFFTVVFGLPLLLLMGIGPLVAWRRASLVSLRRTFVWPFGAAIVAGILLVALGYGSSPAGVAALSLCLFVLITISLEFARGTAARRALSDDSVPRALVSLVSRNRRRYGGYIVHLAVVLLVMGIVGSSAYSTVREATLRPGQTLTVRDYRLQLLRVVGSDGANFREQAAVLRVSRGGETLGELRPAHRTYLREQRASNEIALRTSWRNGEDLFVIPSDITARGVQLKVLVNPLVNLIWLAAIVFAAGSLVAGWPDRREARRLARRYAEEPLPGEV